MSQPKETLEYFEVYENLQQAITNLTSALPTLRDRPIKQTKIGQAITLYTSAKKELLEGNKTQATLEILTGNSLVTEAL